MSLGPGIRRLLRRPASPQSVERDVDTELSFHIETRVEELIAGGMTSEAARLAALREFGDVTAARAQLTAMDHGRLDRARRADWWESVWQDTRFAVRSLRRQPGFFAVCVATLALGIGGNAAIFTIVNAVLVRPLPYERPNELVSINPGVPFVPGVFERLRDQNKSFRVIGGYSSPEAVSVTGDGAPLRLRQSEVSSALFDVLGARAEVGRTFAPGEDRPGNDRVVVLSHAFWRGRFGADASVVGRALTIDGVSRTIVGVVPADFHFLAPRIDVWVPFVFDASRLNVGRHWGAPRLHTIGRLRSGVSFAQAKTEAAVILDRARSAFPWRMPDGFLRNIPSAPLISAVVGDTRSLLLILLGAVGLVLLVACVNVANLFLGRASAREREIAVRASLGAGRRRIVRQMLTETVLIAAAGAAVGLGLAALGVRLLVRLLPAGMPRAGEISLDTNVLVFTAVLAAATGLLFGIVPALNASSPDLRASLAGGARGGTSLSHHRVSRSLVVSQIALAVVLVVGAGLLIKSFWRLHQTDLGFKADNVVVADVPIPSFPSDTAKRWPLFYSAVLDQLRTRPGVTVAAVTSLLPFGGAGSVTGSFPAAIEAHPVAPGGLPPMVINTVASNDYFRAMGIPLLRGRGFTDADRGDAAVVAIVDEFTAHKLWPNEDALGQRLRPLWLPTWTTVVGVVGNVKRDSLNSPDRAAIYVPLQNMSFGVSGTMYAIVRGEAGLDALVPQIRGAVTAVDPNVPVSGFRELTDLVDASAARSRFTMLLLGTFGAIALVLGAVGIYGVVAYAVARRSREIGVRMALGAQRGDVMRMVLSEGAVLAGSGLVVGIAGAFAASRVLARLLYGVAPNDLAVFVSVPILLLGVALGATWIPARRATKVDPLMALRE
jgi:predicted permease